MTRFARAGKRSFLPASGWKELSGQAHQGHEEAESSPVIRSRKITSKKTVGKVKRQLLEEHQPSKGEVTLFSKAKEEQMISDKSLRGKELSSKKRRKVGESGIQHSKDKRNAREEEAVDERRERRREQRRLRRQRKVCFHCRKLGHTVSECQELSSAGGGTGLCYRCGSTEHTSRHCKVKVESSKEFAFAKCFICGETGHLSRHCPDNPRGLYPVGGSCHFCGSVEHRKSDCPENANKTSSQGCITTLKRRQQHESADAEYEADSDLTLPKKKRAAVPKVVTF